MMQAHERVSIEEKSFACEICWRRFAREADLKTHVWIHTQSQEKGFSCDLCHRAFPCATSLNSHFKRTHKDVTLSPPPVVSSPLSVSTPPPNHSIQEVKSPQEQLQLSAAPPSQQHIPITTCHEHQISPSQLPVSPDSAARKNSPPCGVCGKKFAFKYYVKIHQTVHTKEKPYICDLCHKTFSQASSRNRHRKEMHKEESDVQQNGSGLQLAISETSENKIVSQFDVLGKQYQSNRGALYEVHPVPETKEKPYICDLCHKRFTQASSRNRHLKEMHKDGDAPLPPGESPPGTRRAVGVLTRNIGPSCQVCSKRFPCKSLLEIHMRVHTKERPYSCEICYKTFTQVSSRNFHRRKMHKDLILSLLPPPNQEREEQEQQQQLALKQTTLVESGGKLVPECGVCGKRFPCKSLMEIHMRVHTKERPYSCDLCFKTFTQVSSRNFHRRKIHKEQIASPSSQTSSSSQSSLQQPTSLGIPSQRLQQQQQPSSHLTECQQKQLMQSTQLTQHQEQQNLLSQQQQSQLSQQQSQLAQLQLQSQLAHHQTQNAQLSQQLEQQQLNNQQQNPMSPLTQQSQLQQCQLSHQHRQSPLSPQERQSPTSQSQLSPSPTTAQQQQANLHQHSHSHVLHQVQATSPSQTNQSLLGESENKNFHCKMCASSSFNYK